MNINLSGKNVLVTGGAGGIGAEIVKKSRGIASFANWKGSTLTDSGGYQIFSLDPKIEEEGATFRSVYDGSYHKLTPESSADIQADIGADVQMVLDICPALPAPEETIRESVEMTAAWAERGRKTFIDHPDASLRQSQFGIVQGGVNSVLRAESARRTLEIGFDGYAIGGLSVGCLLYTSPSPRDGLLSRMPSSA